MRATDTVDLSADGGIHGILLSERERENGDADDHSKKIRRMQWPLGCGLFDLKVVRVSRCHVKNADINIASYTSSIYLQKR